MSKIHTITVTRDTDERITIRRSHLDLRAFTAETLYEKTYATNEIELEQVLAWCDKYGYDRTDGDAEIEERHGIVAMQVHFVHSSLPDRIDFAALEGGKVRVTLMDRQGRRDIPQDTYTVEGDLQAMASVLEHNGYHVYHWGRGARAFRGTPWPIRSRLEIWKKRQKLEEIARQRMQQNPGKWHDEETLLSMDLAYAG